MISELIFGIILDTQSCYTLPRSVVWCGVSGVGGQLTAVVRSSAGHSIPRSGPAAAAVVATPAPAQQQLRYNFNSYHFTITWNPLPSQRTRRAWRPSDGTSPTWTGAGSWPCCCSCSSCPRRASSGSGGLLVTRACNEGPSEGL